MKRQLLEEGFVRVFDESSRVALRDLCIKLKNEGHAVTWAQTQEGSRITSAEAHHYRTCTICSKPSAADLDTVEGEKAL